MAMEINNVNPNYASYVNGSNRANVTQKSNSLNEKAVSGTAGSGTGKSVADYYSELQKNYDCMSGGNVSISGKYLQQCAGDSKKAKELEDFLKKIPELEKQGYEQLSAQNAALGGKVTVYQQTWMINDDGSVQSSVYSVTETGMTNAERMKKNMDERLEKQKEKKEKEEKIKEQKEKKVEEEEKIQEKDKNMPEISINYIEAETEEEMLSLIQQEKREGAYYHKVDVSI